VANLFDVQGFGALSEYNGQFSTASANQAFQTIASLGSNSIELTARIWTNSATSDSVFADPAKTESDASLLAGFQAAHAAGLSVVFKAAISSLDGTASHALAPSDAAGFFGAYEAEIVHLATIAQEGGVQTFVIGNEMGSLTGSQYRSYWTDIISAVRQVYHGEITYAAATDEASHVSFWDDVDTIGVNTYPPLTSSQTPTVQDLINAWTEVPYNPYFAQAFEYKSPVDFLHSLSEQYNKPVLMTEMGYRSIEGAAISPSTLSSNVTADPNAQADAYNAFFQVWATHGGSWLKGVELWQWDLNNQVNATGFSVMGKPAESVVSQYFHDQGAVPGLTVNAAPVAGVIDVGAGNNVINANLGDKVIHVGDGGDTIYTGPSTLAPLKTTTIELTAWGSVVGGDGAQAQILVNGKPVSAVFEFKPATDPSGYQTYTLTFDNSTFGTINSVDIALLNATSGRSLHVKDFSINGVALGPSDATNASNPGTFDLYVRTIHFDTTNHQDWFVGDSTANDTVYGGAGNDVIYIGAGNDTVDGGGGTNTAAFHFDSGEYNIGVVGNQIVVTDTVAGHGGVDHLTNVQYLKFADTTVSVASLIAPTSPGDAVQMAATGGDWTETIRHADGPRDIHTSGIAGRDHVTEHDTIAAGGADSYDNAGHLPQFAIRHTDGSYDQFNFATSGALTSETARVPEGSSAIDTYGIAGRDSEHLSQQTVTQTDGTTGQSYSARHDAISATGHTLTTTFDNIDGSHTQIASASGVTVSATAGRDIISSAGGDNFVFAQAAGQAATNAVIDHFRVGEAPGHDQLEISSALAPDPAYLSIATMGHDTVTDLGQHGSVTLAGVTAPLTPHDVLIV